MVSWTVFVSTNIFPSSAQRSPLLVVDPTLNTTSTPHWDATSRTMRAFSTTLSSSLMSVVLALSGLRGMICVSLGKRSLRVRVVPASSDRIDEESKPNDSRTAERASTGSLIFWIASAGISPRPTEPMCLRASCMASRLPESTAFACASTAAICVGFRAAWKTIL